MAATTTMVHVRVDENVKAQAAETLASMGLTVSDAIQLTPDQIAHAKAGRWWPPVSEVHIGEMPPAIAQRRIP